VTTTLPQPVSESSAARLITDWLEPKNWIIADTLVLGWHSGRFGGVAWGVDAAVFCALIPMWFIKRGVAAGKYADRHVGARKHRLVVEAFILLSVAVGLASMLVGGAPREMLALVIAMFGTLLALTAVTFVWKISVHQAVSAGSVTMVAVAYGPWILAAFVLVALVGWSRVELRDHTTGQAIAGSILGAALAAVLFAALR
jgi:hypothetical protein